MIIMVDFPDVDLAATIVAFIVSSILGFLWYDARTPMGAYYMSEMGYDVENLDVNNLHFGLDFLTPFIMIYGLGIVVGFSGADDLMGGLQVGLFAWLAFVVTSHWAQVAFEQRKPSVYGLYIGYQLVVFAIAGMLFATM